MCKDVMTITINNNKIFSNNRYVGYITDTADLQCFYYGNPVLVARGVTRSNVSQFVKDWLLKQNVCSQTA